MGLIGLFHHSYTRTAGWLTSARPPYTRAVYGAALLPLLDAVNAAVARATPPSSTPEPHPLPWWDKMRYQAHGTWLVTAQEMHLLHLTAPTYERCVHLRGKGRQRKGNSSGISGSHAHANYHSMSGPLLEASAVSLHLSKVSIFLQVGATSIDCPSILTIAKSTFTLQHEPNTTVVLQRPARPPRVLLPPRRLGAPFPRPAHRVRCLGASAIERHGGSGCARKPNKGAAAGAVAPCRQLRAGAGAAPFRRVPQARRQGPVRVGVPPRGVAL